MNGVLVDRVRLPSFLLTLAMVIAVLSIAEGLKNLTISFAGPGGQVYQEMAWLSILFKAIAHDATGARIVFFPRVSSIVIITVALAVISHLA